MQHGSDAARSALAAFPAAGKHQRRWVIYLEPLENLATEARSKVQLRAAMAVRGDGVNAGQLSGALLARSLPGWGYQYVIYEGEARLSRTRMAHKTGALKDCLFYSEALIFGYNSRLPLVIYTPNSLQIVHSVFRQMGRESPAEQG